MLAQVYLDGVESFQLLSWSRDQRQGKNSSIPKLFNN